MLVRRERLAGPCRAVRRPGPRPARDRMLCGPPWDPRAGPSHSARQPPLDALSEKAPAAPLQPQGEEHDRQPRGKSGMLGDTRTPRPPCHALGSGCGRTGPPARVGALRPYGKDHERFLCLVRVLKYRVAIAVCIALLAASFSVAVRNFPLLLARL